LELRPDLLEDISQRLASRGRAVGENNRRQSFVPQGAVALPNPVGTAPGFVVGADQGPTLVCLPGVPFEMEEIWRSGVEPILHKRFPSKGGLAIRVLKCVGAGESEVDRLLGETVAGTATASIAFQLVGGEVHLRLVGQGTSEEAARGALGPLEAKVRSRLGRLIYGNDGDTLAGVLVSRLKALGERLSVVEGATAGALISALAQADPEGAVFIGGQLVPEAAILRALGGDGAKEKKEGEARALALARKVAREAEAVFGLAATGAVEFAEAEMTATYWVAAVWGVQERIRAIKTSGPVGLINRRAALAALDVGRRLAHGWPEAGP
jgi:nicotinamide-nucleotide amidase